ncbi:MAG: MAE_28990/MAE_18760 family HEPN-like nuclease [Dehalococcoidia bacterium]
MEHALRDFQQELDEIRSYVALAEAVADLRAFAPSKTLERTRLGKSAASIHAGVLMAVRWETIALDGAFLFLAGLYEETFREITRRLVGDVERSATTYGDLSDKVRKSNVLAVAEYLRRPEDSRYGHLTMDAIVGDLAGVLSDGAPVRLFGDGFAHHDRNLRPGEVSEMLGRVGVASLWPQVASQPELQAHFEGSGADLTQRAAWEKLNAFIDTRNAIAHSASTALTVGGSVLRDYADFLEALLVSLVAVLRAWASTL